MDKKQDLILITGATGQQGGAIAHELLSRGYRIRALTRKPESPQAVALAKLNAEIVTGNLDDSESLEKALTGVWGAYSVQNTSEAGVEKEEEQGKRFANLARKAGVQYFVYSSVGSAHRNTRIPHFDIKWRVEETIRGLGFPSHTIIRPVFFMENLLSPWFKPAIDQGKLAMAIKPETKLQMIGVKDIGKYGALAFEKHEHLNGQSIDIAGDELTMPETAQIISRASGKPVVFERTPIEEVRKFSEDYALVLEWFDRVGFNADIPGNVKKYGIPPTRFEKWAYEVLWS